MIDLPTARALVEKELSLNQTPEEQWTIIDIVPVEGIGWIFSYNTSALSAQQPNDALAHIVVDQKDGALRYAGKSKLTEQSMQAFRRTKLARLPSAGVM